MRIAAAVHSDAQDTTSRMTEREHVNLSLVLQSAADPSADDGLCRDPRKPVSAVSASAAES